MPEADPPHPLNPSLRELAETFTALPPRHDHLASRLEFVAELLAEAGRLPNEAVLLWRAADGTIRSAILGTQLTVGRHVCTEGPAFPDDKSLSKAHFTIHNSGLRCEMEDLGSRNGTAINVPEQRVSKKVLRDADLIFAGKQVFVFLDPRRTR